MNKKINEKHKLIRIKIIQKKIKICSKIRNVNNLQNSAKIIKH